MLLELDDEVMDGALGFMQCLADGICVFMLMGLLLIGCELVL